MVGNLISSFVLFRKTSGGLSKFNDDLSNQTLLVKPKDYSKCAVNDVPGAAEQIVKPDVKTVIKFKMIYYSNILIKYRVRFLSFIFYVQLTSFCH